jgi:hypothetical protein
MDKRKRGQCLAGSCGYELSEGNEACQGGWVPEMYAILSRLLFQWNFIGSWMA